MIKSELNDGNNSKINNVLACLNKLNELNGLNILNEVNFLNDKLTKKYELNQINDLLECNQDLQDEDDNSNNTIANGEFITRNLDFRSVKENGVLKFLSDQCLYFLLFFPLSNLTHQVILINQTLKLQYSSIEQDNQLLIKFNNRKDINIREVTNFTREFSRQVESSINIIRTNTFNTLIIKFNLKNEFNLVYLLYIINQ